MSSDSPRTAAPVTLVGMALHKIKQRDRLHGTPCYCDDDAAALRHWHDAESLPDDRHSVIEVEAASPAASGDALLPDEVLNAEVVPDPVYWRGFKDGKAAAASPPLPEGLDASLDRADVIHDGTFKHCPSCARLQQPDREGA